jgi:hypothetical protein
VFANQSQNCGALLIDPSIKSMWSLMGNRLLCGAIHHFKIASWETWVSKIPKRSPVAAKQDRSSAVMPMDPAWLQEYHFFLFFPRFTTPALQVIQEFRDFCPNLMVWCWWKPMKILNFRPIYMKILKFGEAIWKSMGHPKKSKLLCVFVKVLLVPWCLRFLYSVLAPHTKAARCCARSSHVEVPSSMESQLGTRGRFWSRTFGQD